MERKQFLKNSLGFLGTALILPKVAMSCKSDDNSSGTSDSDTTKGGTNQSCTVWPTETEGPFPTKTPSSYVRTDIVGDRTGVDATIEIIVQDVNNSCAPVEGIIVDIWHCDKDGNYSQYGGTQMQQTNYQSYNFLRGRQVTDSDGKVKFTSIFPGWYMSRATHIHVHIYDTSGTSVKVTQIAFPESSASAVVVVNSATSYGYTKGMTGYTYNAQDNVFSDDTTGQQIATVSGSLSEGYTISSTIKVLI
ncbi:intradiol ring-cleavage dioxygenase [Chishuiella sp.]|uniref:dioxygenase family protein n=1 Tax=Chishuiella sp. TaxID=1969467 RepID=UPI0028A91504|nr:intradiol ring-cleavage dioxygenase [Chishuiella sp.]